LPNPPCVGKDSRQDRGGQLLTFLPEDGVVDQQQHAKQAATDYTENTDNKKRNGEGSLSFVSFPSPGEIGAFGQSIIVAD
jgi:hypothetical protein